MYLQIGDHKIFIAAQIEYVIRSRCLGCGAEILIQDASNIEAVRCQECKAISLLDDPEDSMVSMGNSIAEAEEKIEDLVDGERSEIDKILNIVDGIIPAKWSAGKVPFRYSEE